jgi:hypothetical protein
MRWREDGIWGGIGPSVRTSRGAPPQGSLRIHSRGLASSDDSDSKPNTVPPSTPRAMTPNANHLNKPMT